jgi:hypothetical protein
MAEIEVFFDCSSPWTYLAFHNIQPLAAEFGRLAGAGQFSGVAPAPARWSALRVGRENDQVVALHVGRLAAKRHAAQREEQFRAIVEQRGFVPEHAMARLGR